MMQSITTSALARFLKNESLKELNSLFLYSALVGLMSTLLVALINKSAASVAAGESVTGYFFAYLAALIAFYWIAKKSKSQERNELSTADTPFCLTHDEKNFDN